MVAPPNYWAPLDEREGDKENNSNEIFNPGKEVEIKKAEIGAKEKKVEKFNLKDQLFTCEKRRDRFCNIHF